MGIGGKIKRAITGPMNKIKDGILKPIKVVLGLIMKVIKMFKSFVQSIFLYIKCVIKLLVNFHKCVWYYILDAIKYLIQSVILFFVVTIAGLRQQNVKKAVKNTNKFFNSMKYSNGVMNDCYRCKPKGDKKSPSILDMLKKMIGTIIPGIQRRTHFLFHTLFILHCFIFRRVICISFLFRSKYTRNYHDSSIVCHCRVPAFVYSSRNWCLYLRYSKG